jgi:hypothetical protein
MITTIAAGLLAFAPTPAQAVDDGPCPNGTISVESLGSDYSGGEWSLVADGTVFGLSDEEDECITPLPTVDIWRYPGSDGIERADFDERCDGVLVWAYGEFPGAGEFRCLVPAASRTPILVAPAASEIDPTPTGGLPVTL